MMATTYTQEEIKDNMIQALDELRERLVKDTVTIDTFSLTDCSSSLDMYIDPTISKKEINITFFNKPVHKKEIKPQDEIYKELFHEQYNKLASEHIQKKYREEDILCMGLPDDVKSAIRIKANQYACENTVRVWRDQ